MGWEGCFRSGTRLRLSSLETPCFRCFNVEAIDVPTTLVTSENSRLVLARLTESSPKAAGFSTSQIYTHYTRTAKQSDGTILSEHRVYELLKEQAFLGVVESTRTGSGRSQGSYLEHRLVQDPAIVLQSVLRDSRLEDLA